jgi:hypothetical protein
MTSQEFIIWMKGFVSAAHDYTPTPKQWDTLKEKLEEVEDKTLILESPKFPFGTPNTTPMWQHPHYVDPYNPYKVTCTPGTTSTPGMVVTTTPGTTGFITIANPNIVSFSSGSTTSGIATYPVPGATISYTTNGAPNWYTTTIANEKTLLND